MNNFPFTPIVNSIYLELNNEKSNKFKEDITGEVSNITKFILNKEYRNIVKKYYPLIDYFNIHESELLKSNDLIHEFEKITSAKDILKKYFALENILKTKVNYFNDYIDCITARLSLDRVLLEKEFEIKNFNIKYIKNNLGDTHQHGKRTVLIVFEDNYKIIYKPRSGGLDFAFNTVIDKFNGYNKEIRLKGQKILNKDTYCWCEFIEHIPCDSELELKNYYSRAGALLALIFLLQGTDIHFENIIAQKDQPILIDLECLFNNTKLNNFSIFYTGLLPLLLVDNNQNIPVDLSALGANGVTPTNYKIWDWINLDTNALSLIKKNGKFIIDGNQPKFQGKLVSPEMYLELILCGFSKGIDWVLSIQDDLDDDFSNPFLQFKNQPFRIIPRTTQVYKETLEKSYSPQALQDESVRKQIIQNHLEKHVLHLQTTNDEEKWKIVNSEVEAIGRLDIPFFLGNTSETFIKESDELVLEHYFGDTPYESIMKKIKNFKYSEAENQKKIIRSAFYSRYNSQPSILTNYETPKIDTIDTDELIAKEIQLIADTIANQYVSTDLGGSWSTFIELDKSLVFGINDNSLYAGNLGIILFLYHVSKFSKHNRYDYIVNSIIDKEITNYSTSSDKPIDLSYTSGISGLISVLLEFDNTVYLNHALKLSERIKKKHIQECAMLDLMSGISGTLITLCNLYKKTNNSNVLDKCIAIGNYLLDSSIYDDHLATRSWKTIGNKQLTGFSHGASGIGYALLKLYEIGRDDIYKSAFYEAIKYESIFFDAKKSNWRDLRYSEENKFHNSWCHGAVGIGLSRIYAYKILKDESLLTDVTSAIQATLNMDSSKLDHYCCGNIGRIDFLLEAASLFGSEELLRNSIKKIRSFLETKNYRGFYQTYNNPHISLENLTLFRGTAGIGYVLMKSLESNTYKSLGF